jgi:hypothetical protein
MQNLYKINTSVTFLFIVMLWPLQMLALTPTILPSWFVSEYSFLSTDLPVGLYLDENNQLRSNLKSDYLYILEKIQYPNPASYWQHDFNLWIDEIPIQDMRPKLKLNKDSLEIYRMFNSHNNPSVSWASKNTNALSVQDLPLQRGLGQNHVRGCDRPENVTLPEDEIIYLDAFYKGEYYKLPVVIKYSLNDDYHQCSSDSDTEKFPTKTIVLIAGLSLIVGIIYLKIKKTKI